MRTPTQFRKTKALVSKLIRLTIETGTVTGAVLPPLSFHSCSLSAAVFAVIVLILFTTVGGSYYACFGALVAKLYSNVAIAVLNSRIRIMGGRDESQQLSSNQVYAGGAQGLSSRLPPPPAPGVFAVNVTRTEETRADDVNGSKDSNAAGGWDEDMIPMHAMPTSGVGPRLSFRFLMLTS